MSKTDRKDQYFLCVSNEGYLASLQVRTIYRGLPDADAESHGMLRVLDESGEDYLFPASLFVPIKVPEAAAKVSAGAAQQLARRLWRRQPEKESDV